MSTTSGGGDLFVGGGSIGNSQKRPLHSDSSISYQVARAAGMPSTPAPSSPPGSPSYLREESLKELFASSQHHAEAGDIDPESKSILFGVLLVTIMLTSLISFVASKVRRCTHFTDVAGYENCLRYFHFYSIMSIVSCSTTFIIYFLHLISQCDLMCFATHRVEYELAAISLIGSLLAASNAIYFSQTGALIESFSLASFILTDIAIFLYLIRAVMLIQTLFANRKKRRLWRRHLSSTASSAKHPQQRYSTRRSVSRDSSHVLTTSMSNNVTTTPTIQAVRDLMLARQISLSSAVAAHKQKQQQAMVVSFIRNNHNSRKKTVSTSVSDDFDDDVFIQ